MKPYTSTYIYILISTKPYTPSSIEMERKPRVCRAFKFNETLPLIEHDKRAQMSNTSSIQLQEDLASHRANSMKPCTATNIQIQLKFAHHRALQMSATLSRGQPSNSTKPHLVNMFNETLHVTHHLNTMKPCTLKLSVENIV